MEPKQVIVMRTDLGMRKGKMIAQGAHAAMAVILDMKSTIDTVDNFQGQMYPIRVHSIPLPKDGPVNQWIEKRFKKICVRAERRPMPDHVRHRSLQAIQ